MSIGRRPGNALVIDHPDVSRQHCEVVRTSSGHTVQDLESTNGTYVNGIPVRAATLAHGDRIELGPLTLRYEVDSVDDQAT